MIIYFKNVIINSFYIKTIKDKFYSLNEHKFNVIRFVFNCSV